MIGLGAGIGRRAPGSFSEEIEGPNIFHLNDIRPNPTTPHPQCGEEGGQQTPRSASSPGDLNLVGLSSVLTSPVISDTVILWLRIQIRRPA